MVQIARNDVRVQTPSVFRGLYYPALGQVRYRVFYGGRGGAKSWQIGRRLLLAGREQPLRILCGREYQTSIKESVLHLLAKQIKRLNLGWFYKVGRTSIVGLNGTEFIFSGLLHAIDGIKSTEDVDVCWIEEAQSVSEESWSILIPTIRKPGSEIWVSFNPGEFEDPTYQRFVVDPPPRAIIQKVSYLDNPWLSDELREEAETLRQRDAEQFDHVYGGNPWTRSELQVFSGKCRQADLGPRMPHWGEPMFGLDFGFSIDPAILVKFWAFDSRLYIEREAGGVQLDNDDLERRIRSVDEAADHQIFADAARPETINELRKRGLNVVAAEKWAGSVKDGVEYIRGQFEEIIIHPSCTEMISESRLYRWKKHPKTGAPLPKFQEGNDHGWDGVRYGLSPMIKARAPMEAVIIGQKAT